MASFEKLIKEISFPKDKKFAPQDLEDTGEWFFYRQAMTFTPSRRKKLGVPKEDQKRFQDLKKVMGVSSTSLVVAGGGVILEESGPFGEVECDALLTNRAFFICPTDPLLKFEIKMYNKEIVGYKEENDGLRFGWTKISFRDNLNNKEVVNNSNVMLIPLFSDNKQENRRSFSVLTSLVAMAEEQALSREKVKK